jgi:hypothetical protein
MILLMCTAFFCRIDAAKPVLKATTQAISCFGRTDGSIYFVYTYNKEEVINLSVLDSTNKAILNLTISHDTSFQLKNLQYGNYCIQYSYRDKLVKSIVTIENKLQLKANIININKLTGMGTGLVAELKANPSGGTLPYTIQWSDNTGNQMGEIAKDLPLGIYRCVITDANNCGPVSATFFLFDQEIEKYKQKTKSNN